MNRTVKIVIAIIVVLAIAGGSFYGGTVYGKNQAQASFAAAARQRGGFPGAAVGTLTPGGGQRGGQLQSAAQGGALVGQITEIGDGVMVIRDNNGREVRVKVTDTTLIEKQASVTLADLATGETVFISGSTVADGTITARAVQVAPPGRFGMMGGLPGGTPNATPAP